MFYCLSNIRLTTFSASRALAFKSVSYIQALMPAMLFKHIIFENKNFDEFKYTICVINIFVLHKI